MNFKILALALAISSPTLAADPAWIPFKEGQTVSFPETQLRTFTKFFKPAGTSARMNEHCTFRQVADLSFNRLSAEERFTVEKVTTFQSRLRRAQGSGPRFVFVDNENYKVALSRADGSKAELICEALYEEKHPSEMSVADHSVLQLSGVRIDSAVNNNLPQIATGSSRGGRQ